MTRRILSLSLLLFGLALFAPAAVAQQAGTRDAQAVALISRSYQLLTGGVSISDVTLSGTAHRIAGSDHETGTAILRAMINGNSRADFNLPSGQRSEVRNMSVDPPAGAWSGRDGVARAISNHNLLTDSTWFFPTFVIGRALSGTNYVATFVGHETWEAEAVEHLSISQQFAGPSKITAMLQGLSDVELYLDSSTLLPVAMTFSAHPDDDAGLNIQVLSFSTGRSGCMLAAVRDP